VLRKEVAIGIIIQNLLLLAKASDTEEWLNQVLYLPFN
jgi:hypothetical protein